MSDKETTPVRFIPFQNPWPNIEEHDPTAMRVNTVIPGESFMRVKRCRLESGTIKTTVNHLWLKLIAALDKHDIKDYADVRAFEDLVRRAVLVLPEDVGLPTGVPVAGTDSGTPSLSNGGSATDLRPNDQDEPSEHTNVPSDPSKGRGTGGRPPRREKSSRKS